MVGCIGRRQVLEEFMVWCLADPLLLTIPVVVVGIIGNNGAVMEIGGKYPGVIQDQLHHGFCLRLAATEKRLPWDRESFKKKGRKREKRKKREKREKEKIEKKRKEPPL